MARDPGAWYDEKRAEAAHAEWAIQHLQTYLRRLDDRRPSQARRAILQEYLSALVRTLGRARYVGGSRLGRPMARAAPARRRRPGALLYGPAAASARRCPPHALYGRGRAPAHGRGRGRGPGRSPDP